MDAKCSMEQVGPSRIVGTQTATRRALLERIDQALSEACADQVWDLAGWNVEAVLTATRTRRPGGSVVALRVRRVEHSPHDTTSVPWGSLEQVARWLIEEVWEVTTVVPDVTTCEPDLTNPAIRAARPNGPAPFPTDAWRRRLSA